MRPRTASGGVRVSTPSSWRRDRSSPINTVPPVHRATFVAANCSVHSRTRSIHGRPQHSQHKHDKQRTNEWIEEG